jgi:type III pantothenate kinase
MNSPRLIAVDIGNSTTKVGWFAENSPGDRGQLPELASVQAFVTGQTPPDALLESLPKEPCEWRIASVHREGTRVLKNWLASHRQEDAVRVLETRDFPIAIRVDFPERVGLDRLAACVAANVLRAPGRPAIVIGAGSAITVNLIAADGGFEGGAILPGFRMSAEALFGADQLPLTMLETGAAAPPVVGKHTEAAIRSGLVWGAVGGVREIVMKMGNELQRQPWFAAQPTATQQPQVFVTGGDLRPLAAELGGETRFIANLVLAGIAVEAGGR